MEKPKLTKINFDMNGKEFSLTPKEAKQLKKILCDLFPETTTPQIVPLPYPVYPEPYYPDITYPKITWEDYPVYTTCENTNIN